MGMSRREFGKGAFFTAVAGTFSFGAESTGSTRAEVKRDIRGYMEQEKCKSQKYEALLDEAIEENIIRDAYYIMEHI